MDTSHSTQFELEPFDNRRLAILCGQHDENIKQLEQHLAVAIINRGNQFEITGLEKSVDTAQRLLQKLYQKTEHEKDISPAQVHLYLRESDEQSSVHTSKGHHIVSINTKAGIIKGRSPNQERYLRNIQDYDINFGIGPAGTGKTFLAVASAVAALDKGSVERIMLVRPAVEAGERLGFLPGALEQKIEPYLQPLYDALVEMLGFNQVAKLVEQKIIELAPLAYMRGRTLNNAFIILDESQNTTIEQMKMFLTRIGFGSKAIVTGDITQIDLPKEKRSGLIDAMEILKDIEGIEFNFFESKDVVRHTLVQKIIDAYQHNDNSKKS